MIPKIVKAEGGSVGVGGDVNAPIYAFNNSTLQLKIEQKSTHDLPSFLGRVLVFFAEQSLTNYAKGGRRKLPPEVDQKLEHNLLASDDPLLLRYLSYFRMVDDAYTGVEQYNNDARHLVRMKAGYTYAKVVSEGCAKTGRISAQRLNYVRANASGVLQEVIDRMLVDYKASNDPGVEEEIAALAVQLVVFDAVVECEVLERPPDAVTA